MYHEWTVWWVLCTNLVLSRRSVLPFIFMNGQWTHIWLCISSRGSDKMAEKTIIPEMVICEASYRHHLKVCIIHVFSFVSSLSYSLWHCCIIKYFYVFEFYIVTCVFSSRLAFMYHHSSSQLFWGSFIRKIYLFLFLFSLYMFYLLLFRVLYHL